MWQALFILVLLALVAVHLYWQRRWAAASRKHQDQIATLKLAEEELRERFRAEQKALLNSMSEGLLVLDQSNRIQATNGALCELFNLETSVTGQTVIEALRLHTLSEIVSRLEKERQILDLEVEVPGLRSRCLQVNAASILDDDNQRLGSVMVFHDLTRLKQLENTRQEFVANVSHELRTPLSMIKGFTETLLSGAKDDPQVATQFLQTIERHADRLAMLIDDLLTISRLEAGGLSMSLEEVELGDLVSLVFRDLQGPAAARSIHLQCSVADDILVKADYERLKQVLWNLIENAIKYGKASGQVEVAAEVTAGKVRVSIRDDGPGIPPDALSRVFERFYRVDKARSREAGGTGLGLSIVKHLVQRHGGEVWAESTPGKGSVFYFTIPGCSRGKSGELAEPSAQG